MNYDYSNKAAFETIDREGEGVIDLPILAAFFRRHDMPLTESDLLSIMRRIDIAGNAKINFEEFSEFMMPSVNDFLTKTGTGLGQKLAYGEHQVNLFPFPQNANGGNIEPHPYEGLRQPQPPLNLNALESPIHLHPFA